MYKQNLTVFFAITILFATAACKKDEKSTLGSCNNELYNTEYTGVATWYTAEGNMGNCMIEFPADKMYGAMNKQQYDNSNACAAYAKITNPENNKEVIVQIVDQCPECQHGHIDLSPEAFEKLAPLGDGLIDIKWEYIKNPTNKNISIRYKTGSNPWWTAVQVLDPMYMIYSLEAKNNNGEFVSIKRTTYNYFLDESGFKDGQEGPYELRITDVNGHVVTGTFADQPDVIQPTNLQFDDCQ
jgi:expansin